MIEALTGEIALPIDKKVISTVIIRVFRVKAQGKTYVVIVKLIFFQDLNFQMNFGIHSEKATVK